MTGRRDGHEGHKTEADARQQLGDRDYGGWLEDMFAQGWQLEECGFRFAKFRRAEPAKVRCRMMPMQNETCGDQKERETLYEELGWKYLTNQMDRYRIYICRDPHAPELETDPVAAAWPGTGCCGRDGGA